MRGNVLISCVVKEHLNPHIIDRLYPNGIKLNDKHYIIKVRTSQRGFNGDSNTLIRPMELAFKSDLIYDVSKKEFSKNRYTQHGLNTSANLPTDVKPLFSAITDITNGFNINILKSKHNKKILLEAIYLTDTLNEFIDDFQMIDYQLIRYRYGKQMPAKFLNELVTVYPEKLI